MFTIAIVAIVKTLVTAASLEALMTVWALGAALGLRRLYGFRVQVIFVGVPSFTIQKRPRVTQTQNWRCHAKSHIFPSRLVLLAANLTKAIIKKLQRLEDV